MIFRTFTQLMDEDSLLKLNIDDLEIIGAFSIDSELHPDSILLYSKISDFNLEEDEFVSIINSAQSNIVRRICDKIRNTNSKYSI